MLDVFNATGPSTTGITYEVENGRIWLGSVGTWLVNFNVVITGGTSHVVYTIMAKLNDGTTLNTVRSSGTIDTRGDDCCSLSGSGYITNSDAEDFVSLYVYVASGVQPVAVYCAQLSVQQVQ
jgi:hypothetical protein